MSESHSFSGAVRVLEIEHWRDMGYEAMKNRSSHRRCSVKKGVHRNFAIFSEYCEFFKDTYFEEHLRTAVSAVFLSLIVFRFIENQVSYSVRKFAFRTTESCKLIKIHLTMKPSS